MISVQPLSMWSFYFKIFFYPVHGTDDRSDLIIANKDKNTGSLI